MTILQPAWAIRTQALRAATTFYLLLPIGLFVVGWLRPVYALLACLLILLFLVFMGRDVWPAVRAGWLALRDHPRASLHTLAGLAPAGLLLTAWLLLSGAGGLGYQNDDYQASNALFKTLIAGDWPLSFQFDGQPVRVVYYLAYYLPAAVVGKLLGWRAANAALWLWTALGCALAFAWFVRLSQVALRPHLPRRLLVLAVLFCLSGGLDVIAVTVLRGALPAATDHLEFWAGYFQYSSNTTLLYWVPQQALAAWLMLGLVVDAYYNPHDLGYLGLALAAGLLWSPLGWLGLLPYGLLLAGVTLTSAHRRRLLLRPAAFFAHAAALGLAGVLGLYLSANRFSFPAGWVWQGAADPLPVIRYYLGFWWVEFGALAVVVIAFVALSMRRLPGGAGRGWLDDLQQHLRVGPRSLILLAVSLATLTLLPLFRLGYNNDLVMRASIPALWVLWLMTSQVLVGGGQAVARQGAPLRLRLAYGLLVGLVLVGFVPGLTEVSRSLQRYHFGPPHWDAVAAMADADRRHLVEQRVGDDDAFFFRYLAR